MNKALVTMVGVMWLLMAMGCGPAATEPDTAPPATTPTYAELVAKAASIFEATYPDTTTVLFTAVGRPESGLANSEVDLVVWTFDARLESDGKIAELSYSAGSFGSPTIVGSSWYGLMFEPLPKGDVTLSQGIEILATHGFGEGFSSVSMGTPVVADPQPMYWFCVNHQTQGVSSSTGDFFADLFPCDMGPASQPPPGTEGDNEAPGYVELVKEATRIFAAAYPEMNPVLFTATGRPPSGVAIDPSQLTDWRFLANLDTGTVNQTAQVVYTSGGFGSPEIIGGPWLGIDFKALPQGSVTLERAVEVLIGSGFSQGFSSVSMGTPLGPDPQPMYWFCVDGEIQGVSAATAELYPDLFPCGSDRVGLP